VLTATDISLEDAGWSDESINEAIPRLEDAIETMQEAQKAFQELSETTSGMNYGTFRSQDGAINRAKSKVTTAQEAKNKIDARKSAVGTELSNMRKAELDAEASGDGFAAEAARKRILELEAELITLREQGGLAARRLKDAETEEA